MSGNGNGGGGNGGNGGGGTYGGTPIVPTNLIPASTTVLQPGSRYFRLVDAFAQLDQTLAVDTLNNDITALQASIATLQSQMSTVQGQITALQNQTTVFTAFMASFNYQQIEVNTGTIYLDNRIIYRRSFVINGALNTANNVFTYPHLIPAINYIATVQAMASLATGQQLPITFVNMATSPNITVGLGCWADTTNIYISVGNTVFTNYLTLVTLWYTATNR